MYLSTAHTHNFNDIHYIYDEKLCNSRSTINNTLSTIPLAMRCDKHCFSLLQLTMHEQQIASTTKPCDSWPSSHVQTFVCLLLLLHFAYETRTWSFSAIPSLSHISDTTATTITSSLICVYTTTKKNGTCCLFSSQYPYHIFLMCVQFPHSQNNHRTHTLVRTPNSCSPTHSTFPFIQYLTLTT